MLHKYGFSFLYREENDSEQKPERFFIDSNNPDIHDVCERAMLHFLTKKGFYSGKIISVFEY